MKRVSPSSLPLLFLLIAALAGCSGREPGASGASTARTNARNDIAAMGAGAASATGAKATSSASAAASARAAAPPLVPSQVVRATALSQQDLDAGRSIASKGAPGAAACASCHGANGEGNAQSGFPRLAGQGRIYLEHQLNSYADGTRANPVMTPIAGALSAQQRAQVAGFYANLGPAGNADGAPAAGTRAQEPVLVARGDEKRGLQGCANCHGPQGIGDAAANPYLAGQHQQYILSTLAAWKDGTRHNDPSGQMPAIAKALTDDEARSLAAYFARLAPPAPGNAQAKVAANVAANASRPAVQSGPAGPTAPAQGTGTQQGAPLTGGSQGPGAGGAATNPGQTTR